MGVMILTKSMKMPYMSFNTIKHSIMPQALLIEALSPLPAEKFPFSMKPASRETSLSIFNLLHYFIGYKFVNYYRAYIKFQPSKKKYGLKAVFTTQAQFPDILFLCPLS